MNIQKYLQNLEKPYSNLVLQVDNFLRGEEEQVALIRQALEAAEGNILAERTQQILEASRPDLFVEGLTVFRNFHQIDSEARGRILIEGYLLMGGE